MPPHLLYADQHGTIFDHPELFALGSSAGALHPLGDTEMIPLPNGSELFLLPGRLPVGQDKNGKIQILEQNPMDDGPVTAVAAFMAPAHTCLYTAAFHTNAGAPLLPLFAYAAAGLAEETIMAAGLRIDPSGRQDSANFPSFERLQRSAHTLLKRFPHNRLWRHLGHCALTSCCPAARNLMLGRQEAPLPTSPVCNAQCLGCISLQGPFPVTQPRLDFVPTAEEVAEIANYHLQHGRQAMVSFGQGCEGEPLLQGEIIARAIDLIRRRHPAATVNINSNGSLPEVMEALMAAGLSSARVSLNSLLSDRHQAYYRPQGWGLADALRSLQVVKKHGGFTSVNLLCMPGVTDQAGEAEALEDLIQQGLVDMIQWRNLNIDPEVYWQLLEVDCRTSGAASQVEGMEKLIRRLKLRYPQLRHGYFNPVL
jgi:wyosine [tRNA(Phe)-imidazoG37] synthetase (radical SAM superfamily)